MNHPLVTKALCSYHICGVCGMFGLESTQMPWMGMVVCPPASGLKYNVIKFRRPPRGRQEVLELPPFCGQCGKLGLSLYRCRVVPEEWSRPRSTLAENFDVERRIFFFFKFSVPILEDRLI